MCIYVAYDFGFRDGFEFQASSLHVLNILVKLDYTKKTWVNLGFWNNFYEFSKNQKTVPTNYEKFSDWCEIPGSLFIAQMGF